MRAVLRPLRLVALPIAALALAAPAGVAVARPPAQLGPGPEPCLRPDLRLRCPNLVMRKPYELRLIRTPRGRRLLAATNAIVNTGDGPLELRARRSSRRAMRVQQVLRARRGARTVVVRGAGRVDFYDTRTRGRYWKYRHAASFELWALDPIGAPVRLVRRGPKLHYCFRDLLRVGRLRDGRPYRGSPRRARFGACSEDPRIRRDTLGTSVGWADIYPWHYPENWIDVTGLSGCFLYVMRADPGDHIEELREDDNASGRVVRLPWRGKHRAGCPAPLGVPGPAAAG